MTENPPLPPREAVAVPRLPGPPAPHPFPVVASLAPVLVSVLLWVITASALALLFAALGPVVGLASVADAAVQDRRTRRAERLRFDNELSAAETAVTLNHEHERMVLERAHRSAGQVCALAVPDPDRWRSAVGSPALVRIGLGTVRSRLELTDLGPDLLSRDDRKAWVADAKHRLADFRAKATTLRDAPITVDAWDGIGIVGPQQLAVALARAIIVLLANAFSPAEVTLVADRATDAAGNWGWLRLLPQFDPSALDRAVSPGQAAAPGRGDLADSGVVVRFQPREVNADPARAAGLLVAVGKTVSDLPRQCRVRIGFTPTGAAHVLRHPQYSEPFSFAPEFVSLHEAAGFAKRLAASAAREGLAVRSNMLPAAVTLQSLLAAQPEVNQPGSLAAPVGLGLSGPCFLDLVRDGPHAIVGGMTGSGKSELLISWVIAMASRYPPTSVTFLLVDFKGGSTFAAIEHLPHCAGLVTDLDGAVANRALTSLRAELRYRERVVAEAGIRSIDEGGSRLSLPRLVVVVDEFAAMVEGFPELHQLFADVASRGRSLGVHLMLCTQRPSGVMRDAVLANCGLRLSLRVNNNADSTAVVGTDVAAALDPQRAGRVVVSVAGARPEEVQVGVCAAEDIEQVVTRWAGMSTFALRRPWCPPLPSRILLEDLPVADSGIAFGLSDVPEEQRQPVASFQPARDGNVLVIGGRSSGKSTLLATLATGAAAAGAGAVVSVPDAADRAWDVLTSLAAEPASTSGSHRLVLIDDFDTLLSRLDDDYQQPVVELVCALLAQSNRSLSLVITTKSITGGIHAIVGLCDTRLLLRMSSRQEHLLAGGDAADFADARPPGSGSWRGHPVQIAVSSLAGGQAESNADGQVGSGDDGGWRASALERVALTSWVLGKRYAVVSAHPAQLVRRLAASVGSSLDAIELEPGDKTDCTMLIERSVPRADGITIIVADPETWQSRWGFTSALRRVMPLVFDRCSVSEFRMLSGLRALPPLIADPVGQGWIVSPDGSVRRIELPPLTAQTERRTATTFPRS